MPAWTLYFEYSHSHITMHGTNHPPPIWHQSLKRHQSRVWNINFKSQIWVFQSGKILLCCILYRVLWVSPVGPKTGFPSNVHTHSLLRWYARSWSLREFMKYEKNGQLYFFIAVWNTEQFFLITYFLKDKGQSFIEHFCSMRETNRSKYASQNLHSSQGV